MLWLSSNGTSHFLKGIALDNWLLIGCGIFLGAMQRLPDNSSGWRKLRQALGVVLLVLGAAQIVGALSGARDYLRPLAKISGAVEELRADGTLKKLGEQFFGADVSVK